VTNPHQPQPEPGDQDHSRESRWNGLQVTPGERWKALVAIAVLAPAVFGVLCGLVYAWWSDDAGFGLAMVAVLAWGSVAFLLADRSFRAAMDARSSPLHRRE
jgi:hypothetical protein